jgi:hypothetical protein
MGDIYDRVQEGAIIADQKEKLNWILELSRINCWPKSENLIYIHKCVMAIFTEDHLDT